MKDKEKTRISLIALSSQEGHYGFITVEDVLTIIELRDDKIKDLLEMLEATNAN